MIYDAWELHRTEYQLCIDNFILSRLSIDGLTYHLTRLGFTPDEIQREIELHRKSGGSYNDE